MAVSLPLVTPRDDALSSAPRLQTLALWRATLFDRLTKYTFWVVFVVAMIVLVESIRRDIWAFMPMYVPTLLLLGVAAWAKRIGRPLRALSFLIALVSAAGNLLFLSGYLAPNSFVAVVVVAVVLALSVSPRMGRLTIGSFSLLAAAAGVYYVQGGEVVAPEQFDLSDPVNWIRITIAFALLAGLAVESISFISTKLELSEHHNQELFVALESESARRIEALEQHQDMAARLQEAHKLEALGQLAGGVAHDFNNLLTIILGNASILQELHRCGQKEEWNELRAIEEAGLRAADLSRQLLTFGRKQSLDQQLVPFNPAIEACSLLLRRLLPSNIDLRLHLEHGVGSVRAAPTDVDQIVMNLCINARDAMPQGGVLKVSSSRQKRARPPGTSEEDARNQASDEHNEFVCLRVEDSGEGMSRAIQERLFEPFFTTKQMGKGTGLGLSVVHGIVTQNHGFVEIESELETGTSFCIYMPACDQEDAAPRTRLSAEDDLRGTETLLVVDDDEDVLKVHCQILRAAGYQVLPCKAGNEALQTYTEHHTKVALLMTDAIMPDLSGRDLYEKLHALNSRLPVLFCSGYASGTLTPDFFENARRSFLQKPYKKERLLAEVRQLLDEASG